MFDDWDISSEWVAVGYLISAIFFIFGLKKLGHPRTAPRGNQYRHDGNGNCCYYYNYSHEFLARGIVGWTLIGGGILIGSLIGYIMAVKVEMTGMPEMVALFNGFGGAASALVALSETWDWIETTSPDPVWEHSSDCCCWTICIGGLDDIDRLSTSYVQTKGRSRDLWEMD